MFLPHEKSIAAKAFNLGLDIIHTYRLNSHIFVTWNEVSVYLESRFQFLWDRIKSCSSNKWSNIKGVG